MQWTLCLGITACQVVLFFSTAAIWAADPGPVLFAPDKPAATPAEEAASPAPLPDGETAQPLPASEAATSSEKRENDAATPGDGWVAKGGRAGTRSTSPAWSGDCPSAGNSTTFATGGNGSSAADSGSYLQLSPASPVGSPGSVPVASGGLPYPYGTPAPVPSTLASPSAPAQGRGGGLFASRSGQSGGVFASIGRWWNSLWGKKPAEAPGSTIPPGSPWVSNPALPGGTAIPGQPYPPGVISFSPSPSALNPGPAGGTPYAPQPYAVPYALPPQGAGSSTISTPPLVANPPPTNGTARQTLSSNVSGSGLSTPSATAGLPAGMAWSPSSTSFRPAAPTWSSPPASAVYSPGVSSPQGPSQGLATPGLGGVQGGSTISGYQGASATAASNGQGTAGSNTGGWNAADTSTAGNPSGQSQEVLYPSYPNGLGSATPYPAGQLTTPGLPPGNVAGAPAKSKSPSLVDRIRNWWADVTAPKGVQGRRDLLPSNSRRNLFRSPLQQPQSVPTSDPFSSYGQSPGQGTVIVVPQNGSVLSSSATSPPNSSPAVLPPRSRYQLPLRQGS